MRKILFIFISITMLAVSCNNQQQPSNTPTETEVAQENQPNESAEIHPVSLQALMDKQYDGRDLTIGPVQAETANYTRYYITYKSGELTISGIMNVPKGNGPFPVVTMNHGYIDPAIYTNGRGLRREQDYFGSRGYVVIHPDYRNHAQSTKVDNVELDIRLGYIEDVINSIYALKNANLPYADTNRIAMIGHSMGGGIAQAVMVVQPELVDAFMLYAPVSSDVRDNYYRWTNSRPEVVAQIDAAYGSPEDNPEFWANVSPVTFFSQVKSPSMINHGENDDSVPIQWSERTYNELQKQGKEVIFHRYPNEGHEFGPAWSTVMQRTLDFFNEKLK